MCHVRGFRHLHCGHTTCKKLSSCRGTFAFPTNTKIPRCTSPSPGLIIHFDQSCRECQYQKFCDDWQSRIQDVKEQRNAFCSLLSDMDVSELDAWVTETEADREWQDVSGPNDSKGADCDTTFLGSDDALTCDGNCNSWCNSPNCPLKNKTNRRSPADEPTSHFCDAGSLRNERTRLTNEIERLQEQYSRQAWEEWHQHGWGKSQVPNWERSLLRKRKRTSPKISCGSPLKEVMSIEDLTDPPELIPSTSADSDSDESLTNSDSNESPETISDTSVRSSASKDKRLLWRDWEESDVTCPLTQQAHSKLNQEAPMMSKEWMRSFRRLTFDEVNAKDTDTVTDGLLPDWGAA